MANYEELYWSTAFKRSGRFPLDSSTLFESKSELEAELSKANSTLYVGQVVAVKSDDPNASDDEAKQARPYFISNERIAIPLARTSGADIEAVNKDIYLHIAYSKVDGASTTRTIMESNGDGTYKGNTTNNVSIFNEDKNAFKWTGMYSDYNEESSTDWDKYIWIYTGSSSIDEYTTYDIITNTDKLIKNGQKTLFTNTNILTCKINQTTSLTNVSTVKLNGNDDNIKVYLYYIINNDGILRSTNDYLTSNKDSIEINLLATGANSPLNWTSLKFVLTDSSTHENKQLSEIDYIDLEDIAIIEQAINGVSKFKSFVFTRTNLDLSTAVLSGGNYLSPIPTETKINDVTQSITWTDTISNNIGNIWMSSCVFESDDLGTTSWSTPTLMADSIDFDVEFSCNNDLVAMTYGNLKKELYNKATEEDKNGKYSIYKDYNENDITEIVGTSQNVSTTNYTFINQAQKDLGWVDEIPEGQEAIWMATATYKNGQWSGWQYNKIKGEPGDSEMFYKVFVFKRSAANPGKPTNYTNQEQTEQCGPNTSFVPYGWNDTVPTDSSITLWMSSKTFNSNNTDTSNWSEPIIMQDTNIFDVEYCVTKTHVPMTWEKYYEITETSGDKSGELHGTKEQLNDDTLYNTINTAQSELGWKDTVEDGEIAYWMATSNYNSSTGWSSWVYSQIYAEPGAPAYTLSVKNNTISVACDNGGTVKTDNEYNVENSIIKLFCGGEQIDLTDGYITEIGARTGFTITPSTITDTGDTKTSIQLNITWQKGTTGIRSGYIPVSITYNDIKLYASIGISCTNDGLTPGETISYNIVPIQSSIIKETQEDNSILITNLTDNKIQAQVTKYVGKNPQYGVTLNNSTDEYPIYLHYRYSKYEIVNSVNTLKTYIQVVNDTDLKTNKSLAEITINPVWESFDWILATEIIDQFDSSKIIDVENIDVVKDIKGIPGISSVTSFVFKCTESTTTPDKPGDYTDAENTIACDYDNLLPYGWSDTIPTGNGLVYMSYRTFYSDNRSTSWSTPKLMIDTPDFDVEFFTSEILTNANKLTWANYYALDDVDTGTNTGEIHGTSTTTSNYTDINNAQTSLGWVDEIPTGQTAYWMATSNYKNGEWTSWQYTKIKGEDGLAGEDGYTISTINENISISCDSNSITDTDNEVYVYVELFKGSENVTLTSDSFENYDKENNNYGPFENILDNFEETDDKKITVGQPTGTTGFEIKDTDNNVIGYTRYGIKISWPKGIKVYPGNFVLPIKVNSNVTLYKTLNISTSRQGATITNMTQYKLMPTETVLVKYPKDDESTLNTQDFTKTTISCGVAKQTNGNIEYLSLTDNNDDFIFSLYLQVDGNIISINDENSQLTVTTNNLYATYNTLLAIADKNSDITKTHESFTWILCNDTNKPSSIYDTNVIDIQDIGILENGSGIDGKAGEDAISVICTNQMIHIPCEASGQISENSTEYVEWKVYQGIENGTTYKQLNYTIKILDNDTEKTSLTNNGLTLTVIDNTKLKVQCSTSYIYPKESNGAAYKQIPIRLTINGTNTITTYVKLAITLNGESIQGDSIATVTNYYAVGTSGTTTPYAVGNANWQTTIPAFDEATGKIYLWNYEHYESAEGKDLGNSTPHLINNGVAKSIKWIIELYGCLDKNTTSVPDAYNTPEKILNSIKSDLTGHFSSKEALTSQIINVLQNKTDDNNFFDNWSASINSVISDKPIIWNMEIICFYDNTLDINMPHVYSDPQIPNDLSIYLNPTRTEFSIEVGGHVKYDFHFLKDNLDFTNTEYTLAWIKPYIYAEDKDGNIGIFNGVGTLTNNDSTLVTTDTNLNKIAFIIYNNTTNTIADITKSSGGYDLLKDATDATTGYTYTTTDDVVLYQFTNKSGSKSGSNYNPEVCSNYNILSNLSDSYNIKYIEFNLYAHTKNSIADLNTYVAQRLGKVVVENLKFNNGHIFDITDTELKSIYQNTCGALSSIIQSAESLETSFTDSTGNMNVAYQNASTLYSNLSSNWTSGTVTYDAVNTLVSTAQSTYQNLSENWTDGKATYNAVNTLVSTATKTQTTLQELVNDAKDGSNTTYSKLNTLISTADGTINDIKTQTLAYEQTLEGNLSAKYTEYDNSLVRTANTLSSTISMYKETSVIGSRVLNSVNGNIVHMVFDNKMELMSKVLNTNIPNSCKLPLEDAATENFANITSSLNIAKFTNNYGTITNNAKIDNYKVKDGALTYVEYDINLYDLGTDITTDTNICIGYILQKDLGITSGITTNIPYEYNLKYDIEFESTNESANNICKMLNTDNYIQQCKITSFFPDSIKGIKDLSSFIYNKEMSYIPLNEINYGASQYTSIKNNKFAIQDNSYFDNINKYEIINFNDTLINIDATLPLMGDADCILPPYNNDNSNDYTIGQQVIEDSNVTNGNITLSDGQQVINILTSNNAVSGMLSLNLNTVANYISEQNTNQPNTTKNIVLKIKIYEMFIQDKSIEYASSKIEQSENSILLEVSNGLNTTGIDITSGIIELNSENTKINGNLRIINKDEGILLFNEDNECKIKLSNSDLGTWDDMQLTSNIINTYYNNTDTTMKITNKSTNIDITIGNTSSGIHDFIISDTIKTETQHIATLETQEIDILINDIKQEDTITEEESEEAEEAEETL